MSSGLKMGELEVRSEILEGVTILRLGGEFEGLSVLNKRETLFGFLGETSKIVLDFGEIEYIDSAGIGVLLDMSKKALEKSISFGLLNVRDAVRRVIELTKVDKLLTIYS